MKGRFVTISFLLAVTSSATLAQSAAPQRATLPSATEPCDGASETPVQIDSAQSLIRRLVAPSAIRSCYISPPKDGRSSLHLIQSGVHRGARFEIWEANNGGGHIQGDSEDDGSRVREHTRWNFTCSVDAITDEKTCSLNRDFLWIYRTVRGYSIAVGGGYRARGANYPGAPIAVRIDGIPAWTTTKRRLVGAQAREILAALRRSRSLIRRHREWPSRADIDVRYSLFGASAALDILEVAFTSIP